MRKTILSLSFILAASVGFTHAQDVLKKHGFKKKPLTFCDGQYNEFFNNPEVVQIGTTLFNTKTNKVVKLLDDNTPKTTYKAEFSSMSIDPHAEKYYSISPYVYCLNNPIKFIDPDGKEVWLSYTFSDGRSVTAQYKNGGLFNSDGSKYQGGNSYILKTGQQLSQLQNVSKEIKGIVSSLANDDNIHTITNFDSANPNEEGNYNRSVNIVDDGIIKGITESNNSITKYDPDATENVAGDKRDPKVGLAHELKHDYDRANGGLREGTTKNGVKNYEVDAVNVENQVRRKTADPQRTTYGDKKIPKEDLK